MGQRESAACRALCRHEVRRVNELQLAPRVLSSLAMGWSASMILQIAVLSRADAEMVLGGFWGMEEGVSLLCHDGAVWGVVCWRCGRFPRWQRRGRGWF